MKKKMFLKKICIIAVWILLWQIASVIVHNPIYFAGPIEVVKELLLQVKTAAFWAACFGSLLRILAGFFIAFLCGYLLAFCSHRFRIVRTFFEPFVTFLKSVPVAAVVVVLLIWFGSKYIVLLITFMVVLPNIYQNMLAGLSDADPALLEMMQVYEVPYLRRFFYLYRPAYLPFLKSAFATAIGMSFKSGIAAEIIGLPASSIGERLYMDKIYLNTAGVFSWMAVIITLSAVAERLLLWMLEQSAKFTPRIRASVKGTQDFVTADPSKEIVCRNLKKAFGAQSVLRGVTAHFAPGKIYCIMGESGCGKTTLLRILSGLERADEGEASVLSRPIGMQFQEDRLIPSVDAYTNLALVGCGGEMAQVLSEALGEEVHGKPVETLSGGQKRRVALTRALLCPGSVVVLDEPFTGLDEENRKKMIGLILRLQLSRTILIVTHEKEDVRALGGEQLTLSEGLFAS